MDIYDITEEDERDGFILREDGKGYLPRVDKEARKRLILDNAPEESFFQGYGGSSEEWETFVFAVHYPKLTLGFGPSAPYSTEVRFPMFPREDVDLDTIEGEYGCYAANDWESLKERYNDD